MYICFWKLCTKKKKSTLFLPPGSRSVEASESCWVTCETENWGQLRRGSALEERTSLKIYSEEAYSSSKSGPPPMTYAHTGRQRAGRDGKREDPHHRGRRIASWRGSGSRSSQKSCLRLFSIMGLSHATIDLSKQLNRVHAPHIKQKETKRGGRNTGRHSNCPCLCFHKALHLNFFWHQID